MTEVVAVALIALGLAVLAASFAAVGALRDLRSERDALRLHRDKLLDQITRAHGREVEMLRGWYKVAERGRQDEAKAKRALLLEIAKHHRTEKKPGQQPPAETERSGPPRMEHWRQDPRLAGHASSLDRNTSMLKVETDEHVYDIRLDLLDSMPTASLYELAETTAAR